jgi:hypothetical protein
MSILDFLGLSSRAKAINLLKKNNLVPQANLLSQWIKFGFQDWDEDRRNLEIAMLVKLKVDRMAAMHSLVRFTQAKDICADLSLQKEANYFQNYVDIYAYYFKDFDFVTEKFK